MGFHEYSKAIVEDYLGTVAYVDDLIFTNKKDTDAENLGKHEMREIATNGPTAKVEEDYKKTERQLVPNIDPLTFTNAFLEKGIHCALLELSENKSNFESIKKTLKKSDVIILDWQMHSDLGRSACELVESILSEDKNTSLSLRLLVIYTDQPVYNTLIHESIVPIFDRLVILYNVPESGTEIISGHTKIIVFQKPKLGIAEDGKITGEDLPEKIIEEMSMLTEGLVSNLAIESISSIRKHTHRLLAVYSNQLDPAYLSHKSLLPNTEDSKEQIIDLLGSEIKSIIKSTVTSDEKIILPLYFDQYYKGYLTDFILSNKEKFTIDLPDNISGEELLKITEVGIENYFLKKEDPIEQQILFSKSCYKNLTTYYTNCREKAEQANKEYAIITTLKSLTDSDEKHLSQGTILIEDKTNQPNYWLCVQPKCDSVRICTKKRDFLFLRLFIGDNQDRFDIVLPDGVKLTIDYRVFFSSLISFKSKAKGKVTSIVHNGQFKFEKGDNLKMIWLGELKNNFAQYVSNKFSTQLSRVGIDHFEWLRRSSIV